DGDSVTVSASGFPPYTPVTVSECSPPPSGPNLFGYPGGCQGLGGGPVVTTDESGAIGPVTVQVHVESQANFGPGPTSVITACPPTAAQQQAGVEACVISVATLDGSMAAADPIGFATGVTAPAPPPVPVSPAVAITAI